MCHLSFWPIRYCMARFLVLAKQHDLVAYHLIFLQLQRNLCHFHLDKNHDQQSHLTFRSICNMHFVIRYTMKIHCIRWYFNFIYEFRTSRIITYLTAYSVDGHCQFLLQRTFCDQPEIIEIENQVEVWSKCFYRIGNDSYYWLGMYLLDSYTFHFYPIYNYPKAP